MPDEPTPHSGGCMCGSVRFEVTKPPLGAANCYCKRCQRRTGTAFSVTALPEPGTFRITTGEDSVRCYDPGDGGWVKGFCTACGGQLYTSHPENPDLIAVRMGDFDEDPGVRAGAHQFVAYKASCLRDPGRRSSALPRAPGVGDDAPAGL